MWPCGIIAFVRELFNAELKSQVYGHLHQYLQTNTAASDKLSECVTICTHIAMPCCV